MYETKYDEILRENRDFETQVKKVEAEKQKVLDLLEESRLNHHSVEKRLKEHRLQIEDLNRQLDQHDEYKFKDLKTLKGQ